MRILKTFLLVMGWLWLTISLEGKEKKYPVSEIPKDLLENADAVVRYDKRVFSVVEVHDINSGTYTRTYAVTIGNEQAQYFGYFVNTYFGKSGLQQFSGTVYNARGEEIDKIKKSDLEDRSRFDGFSIYSDSRYESATYSHHEYPYTIEYEFTEKYDGMMFYPSWRPQWSTKLAVQHADFQVIVPKNMGLRYKELNLSNPAEIKAVENTQEFSWSLESLQAILSDEVGPNWKDLSPTVILGPNEFEFEGYAGNMSSWEEFGKWQQLVNKELGEVSSETKAILKELVSDAKDDKDRVRKVYQYLQQNTRYVSVQLGIGGWQPFPPSYVEENGYGDCKALSFFTKSMLKSVGIGSLYTLVKAGPEREKIYTDFPSDQFNHVFLCVPLASDTVWLECTNQSNPFGYLGTFTSDRPVLLITEDGGKLVRTPVLTSEQNQKITSALVTVDEQGNAQAQLTTRYRGLFSEGIRQKVLPMGVEDQKKWLYKNLNLPSFQIDNIDYLSSGEESPEVTQSLDIFVRKKASVSGKRLFLQPSLLNQITQVPDLIEDRQTDIVIKYNRIWNDTIVYSLPERFHPEYIPDGVALESPFGSYSVDFVQEAGQIKYIRHLDFKRGKYSPDLYDEYRSFYQEIVKADKMKIVMKNAT